MSFFRIHTMLFPGGKRKALTLSYDDGVRQDLRLIKLMKDMGVKGTFNLNFGALGRTGDAEMNGKMIDFSTVAPKEAAEVYEGFEIATHTAGHTALTNCGASAMSEIVEDRTALEKLVPYLVRGHAYPFGMYDKKVIEMLKAAGIQYARTVRPDPSFRLPEDFYEWNPTCHHGEPKLMELIQRFCEEDAPLDQPRLFYLWGHSYEFDMDQNWDVIETFLSYVSGFRDKIWMASNIEIVDYVKAFQALVYSADGSRVQNPSAQTVWMEWLDEIYVISSAGIVNLKG